ncbi:hypothetical protein [Streptomyces lydicus]|uniref:hypothetical protein n=1 Tax=Streptomyces lydicus TaxID=47763 RepID=UPI0037B422A6
MPQIVRRNARVILLDGEDLVLIKRTRPGREPYWVAVGGGVEDALHCEVFEEPGGTSTAPLLVFLITDLEQEPTHFECFWVPLEAAHILQSGQGALLGRLYD